MRKSIIILLTVCIIGASLFQGTIVESKKKTKIDKIMEELEDGMLEVIETRVEDYPFVTVKNNTNWIIHDFTVSCHNTEDNWLGEIATATIKKEEWNSASDVLLPSEVGDCSVYMKNLSSIDEYWFEVITTNKKGNIISAEFSYDIDTENFSVYTDEKNKSWFEIGRFRDVTGPITTLTEFDKERINDYLDNTKKIH
ncbi:hypothetical protein ABFP60_02100 [Clostridioides difficile]